MLLTDYTSYDEIRLCIGVRPDELEDSDLALPIYVIGLKSEFYSVNSSLLAELDRIRLAPEEDRTEAEVNLLDTSRLFASYAVAMQAYPSLPYLAVKKLDDGKASVERHNDAYKDGLKAVEGMFDKVKNILKDIFDNSVGAAVPPAVLTYMAVSSPVSDPILGT